MPAFVSALSGVNARLLKKTTNNTHYFRVKWLYLLNIVV